MGGLLPLIHLGVGYKFLLERRDKSVKGQVDVEMWGGGGGGGEGGGIAITFLDFSLLS